MQNNCKPPGPGFGHVTAACCYKGLGGCAQGQAWCASQALNKICQRRCPPQVVEVATLQRTH